MHQKREIVVIFGKQVFCMSTKCIKNAKLLSFSKGRPDLFVLDVDRNILKNCNSYHFEVAGRGLFFYVSTKAYQNAKLLLFLGGNAKMY